MAAEKRTISARLLGVLIVALVFVACTSDGDPTGSGADADSTGTEAAESAVAEKTSDCDDLVGVWEAGELAGGEEEVGGIYRATLRLPPSGEVTWSESDSVEAWSSWTCVGTEIIGFSDSSVRWVDGEQVVRDPNPCTDFTTSAPRRALPDETIDASSTWVRCRSGKFEEGAVIATALDNDTVLRNTFTLTR